MSAFGVLDFLAHPRGDSRARGEPTQADWREHDGLLLAVSAALLAHGKDGQHTRQVLVRLFHRGMLGEACALLARSDAGAAGLAAHLAARLAPAVGRSLQTVSGEPRQLKPEEESLLAEWLRLAASAADRLLGGSGDRRLRSRLALSWGCLVRLAAGGEAWLEDGDSRVRANAVESLWGGSDEQAAAIFTRKLDDPHQRVAANAAVGLYLAGRSESVTALWKMSKHDDPAFRTAAAWAMGRTGDARFLPLLAEMRKSKAAPVSLLRNVVLARERILHADELPRQSAEIRLDRIASRGPLSLAARLIRRDSGPAPPLRPTDFALECNGQTTWEYRAWRTSLKGPGALGLAVPGPSEASSCNRAAEIASEAGELVRALPRLCLGYDDRQWEGAKTGDVLGLTGAAGEGWFASGASGWRSLARRAAESLASNHASPCLLAAVERGAPGWLGPSLPGVAQDCAALGVRFVVLHEPAVLHSTVLDAVRGAGGDAAVVQDGGFAAALRNLIENPEETWRIEAPLWRAEDIQQVKLVLRSGWCRGEAEAWRAC